MSSRVWSSKWQPTTPPEGKTDIPNHTRYWPRTAKCSCCGQRRVVWMNDESRQGPDGVLYSKRPGCQKCCEKGAWRAVEETSDE